MLANLDLKSDLAKGERSTPLKVVSSHLWTSPEYSGDMGRRRIGVLKPANLQVNAVAIYKSSQVLAHLDIQPSAFYDTDSQGARMTPLKVNADVLYPASPRRCAGPRRHSCINRAARHTPGLFNPLPGAFQPLSNVMEMK